MSLSKRFGQLKALSPRERTLFLEAALWLAISRVALHNLPFRWIAPHLGKLKQTTDLSHPTAAQKHLCLHIDRAIQRAGRHMPWESKCLVRAMAAKAMFKNRKVPTTLYLGVAKEAPSNLLNAHAWLKCGSWVITGRGNLDQYTVVAWFGEKNR